MSARVERKYGGYTLAQLRTMCAEREGQQEAKVLSDLLTEVELLQADELLPRLRRIETKMHRMAVHVGAEPEGTTMTLSVQAGPNGAFVVQVPGYDVTFSQVRRALEESGVDMRHMLHIVKPDNSPLATLYLTGTN